MLKMDRIARVLMLVWLFVLPLFAANALHDRRLLRQQLQLSQQLVCDYRDTLEAYQSRLKHPSYLEIGWMVDIDAWRVGWAFVAELQSSQDVVSALMQQLPAEPSPDTPQEAI